MNTLEQSMFDAGFRRCPNCDTRWYAGWSGRLEPAYPMELRVTDAIWLVTKPYANVTDLVPLMRFETVASLDDYLTRNGRVSEALPAFANGWD